MREEVRAEVRAEVKAEVKEEVKAEVKEEVKAEVKEEVKAELWQHFLQLITKMTEDGMSAEIPRLSTDAAFFDAMLEKYHLGA